MKPHQLYSARDGKPASILTGYLAISLPYSTRPEIAAILWRIDPESHTGDPSGRLNARSVQWRPLVDGSVTLIHVPGPSLSRRERKETALPPNGPSPVPFSIPLAASGWHRTRDSGVRRTANQRPSIVRGVRSQYFFELLELRIRSASKRACTLLIHQTRAFGSDDCVVDFPPAQRTACAFSGHSGHVSRGWWCHRRPSVTAAW